MTVWVSAHARHKLLGESVRLVPRVISDSPLVFKTDAPHVSALEDLESAPRPSIHGHRWERFFSSSPIHINVLNSAGDVPSKRTEDKSR